VIDQDRVPVRLKAGTNAILLKVYQNTQGWEFCVRIITPDGKPLPLKQKADCRARRDGMSRPPRRPHLLGQFEHPVPQVLGIFEALARPVTEVSPARFPSARTSVS
jgi:hypothetical protein